VTYRCPRCHAKLTASAGDAGERRECPHCRKMLKVPGAGEAADSASQRSHAPSKTGGIANIPVICPLCGTRMYATKDQIGQAMVCPDCLESVVVPNHSPPKPKPSPSVPDGQTPPPETDAAGASAAEQPEGAEADEPDDYKLADAIKLPRHLSVSKALGHLIDRHIEPAQDEVVPAEKKTTDHEVDPPSSPAPPPPGPRSFTVKCPVCDAMLQATEEEIGTEKKCPDCFSLIEIRRPPPKRPRVNPVVQSDEADEDFTLSEPVSLDIYKPTAEDGAPRTMGEEALRNARRARVEREEEASDLPLSPLWTGVFAFLPDVAAILRIVITGVLLGGLMKLMFVVVGAAFSPNPMHQFLGMIGSVAAVGLGVLTISLVSTNFLTVLQQSADGLDRIESWPENNLVEWVGESIPVVMAVFFAAAPAMLLIVPFSGIRARPEIAGFLLGGSLYLCFPITQMSILESASVANPLSKPIIDSLRDQFLLWCTFYIMTFFLALAVVIALSFVSPGHPTFVLVALGLFISFCGMLYARLLGRLVWACQMGVVNEEEPEEEESDRRHKNFWLGR
ncbi:MAG: hypothetical protein ACODAD_07555, partial [Planctomycetota bacterium]